MHAAPRDSRVNALIGLAGPAAGLLAALAAQAAWYATGLGVLRAVARGGAVLNLFNLAPIWQLDGARGITPLSRGQRVGLAAVMGGALAVSGERMLWLPLLLLGVQVLSPRQPARGDWPALAAFAALVAALAWVAVAGGPGTAA